MRKKNSFKTKILLRMKLTALLLIAGLTIVSAANTYSQNTTLSVQANNQTVQSVLDQIEEQSEFHFFYNTKQINTKQIVSISESDKSVFEVLDRLFSNTNVSYEVLDKNIILSTTKKRRNSEAGENYTAAAQQNGKRVTGVVLDPYGDPVIGANIVEKGTTNGVVTGINGDFSIMVANNATLQISYIGYTTKEVSVTTGSSFNVTLEEDTRVISEVVVTALGIKREEKALGYSVQRVSGDETTIAKGTNVATSLTGKVAGLNIMNSPDFNQEPALELRGVKPIIVIDGVHSENVGLRELAADDIESMEILKGGTASALYGESGKNGAIMITTKRASKDGVIISVNSNTMVHAGFLRLPNVQSSYSSGMKGTYMAYDECWGDKMDIGRTAVQYDPLTNEWYEQPLVSKGKNNLKNFMQNSFVTNNNVNVAYKGKLGSFRSSLNHVYHKGVWPNNKENRFTYTMSGEAKLADNLTIDASMSYSKRLAPQNLGGGDYGWRSYIYQMGVWTGADYDIRDFRDYWKHGKENEEQNWHYDIWYNNPWFMAYETLQSYEHDRFFGQFNTNWTVTSWFRTILRVGYDSMNSREENIYPISHRSYKTGEFDMRDSRGYSVKTDLIGLFDYKIGDFSIDGLIGGSLNYRKSDYHRTYTMGGLAIPGFYSLSSGKEGVTATTQHRAYQTNSIYGKIGFGWRSMLFVEATGRNDWSSTLSEDERSYFYPSVGASFIPSELIQLPEWFNYWKLRGSWATSKKTPDYNVINPTYKIDKNIWDGANGASHQESIRPSTLKPESQIDWEVGTEVYFLKNQLRLDVAYYERLTNDRLAKTEIPRASGFKEVYVNMDETRQQRGLEITLSGDPIKTKDFQWTASVNWSKTKLYYKKIDPEYSQDYLWVHNGAPVNYYVYKDWERDPEGNMVFTNGFPTLSNYNTTKGLKDPDFFWGFTNHFRYKDWRLSISFDGRVGGYAWDQTSQAMWHSGSHIDSDTHWRYQEVVEGVEKPYVAQGVKVVSGSVTYDSYGRILEDTRQFAPNDVAVSYNDYMKRYNTAPSGSGRDQWVNEMTFFKLREISIGYTIPKHIVSKLKLNDAEVSLTGQNLLLWSKHFKQSDPDGMKYNSSGNKVESIGLLTPAARQIGLNIKFSF